LFGDAVRTAYAGPSGTIDNAAIARALGISRQAVQKLIEKPASTIQLKTVLKLVAPLRFEEDRRAVFDAWAQDCLSALEPVVPSQDAVDRVEELARQGKPELALAVAREALGRETHPKGRLNLYLHATTLSLRIDDAASTVEMCEEILDWGLSEGNRDLQAMAAALHARALRYLEVPFGEVHAAQERAGALLGAAGLKGNDEARPQGWAQARPAAYFAYDVIESEYAHLMIEGIESGRLEAATVEPIRKLVARRKAMSINDVARVRALTLEARVRLIDGRLVEATEALEAAESIAERLGRAELLCGPVRGRLLVARGDLDGAYAHHLRLAKAFRHARHLYLARQMQVEVARLARVGRLEDRSFRPAARAESGGTVRASDETTGGVEEGAGRGTDR
jgi:plasmid maintenance system antidote protein VapI